MVPSTKLPKPGGGGVCSKPLSILKMVTCFKFLNKNPDTGFFLDPIEWQLLSRPAVDPEPLQPENFPLPLTVLNRDFTRGS